MSGIGDQLVTAMRDARAAQGDDLQYFPAFAVGYLEGLLNDLASLPEARRVIELHLSAQRSKAGGRAMTAVFVTAHAAARYQERVNPALTIEQARLAIHSHAVAIGKAAAFGCNTALLARGVRLRLDGLRVITVVDTHPAHAPIPQKVRVRSMRKLRREDRA